MKNRTINWITLSITAIGFILATFGIYGLALIDPLQLSFAGQKWFVIYFHGWSTIFFIGFPLIIALAILIGIVFSVYKLFNAVFPKKEK